MMVKAKGLAKGIIEGIAKGKAEGKAEGIAEGEHKILSHLLELKFGKLTPEIAKRLQALAEHELEQIGERLLNAKSIDDVLPSKKH